MNPLNSIVGSIVLGFIIAVAIALGIAPHQFSVLGFARWFHILSGITWIGLLYYFNVVQTPAMARAARPTTRSPIPNAATCRAISSGRSRAASTSSPRRRASAAKFRPNGSCRTSAIELRGRHEVIAT